MADSANASGADVPSDETPNQKQARLRREKRQKKMDEQGEDRLARIKALNSGTAPPEEILGGPSKQATVEDPEEGDISSITYTSANSRSTNSNAHNDPIMAAMAQMQAQDARNRSQQNAEGSSEADPMVRMMEQMMGMMGGNPQDPNAIPPDLPPALKALLGTAGASAVDQTPPATESTYLWKIVHAVFAVVLAGYIALTTTFNGSQLSRTQNLYTESDGYGFGTRLTLLFCTSQLVLQSTRYFAEKGQLQGNGMIAKVANSGFLPEPWAGYVRILGRYVGIAQTVFRDAMVVVFVFGAMAWWRGMAAA